jgi:hypothetical protein
MTAIADRQDPMVTSVKLLCLQVCVPDEWDNEAIRTFANEANLCGTTNGWVVSDRPEVAPVPCEGRKGFKHVILDC